MKVRGTVSFLVMLAVTILLTSWQQVWAAGNGGEIKRVATMTATEPGGKASGIAKITAGKAAAPQQRFQLIATGLQPEAIYRLVIDGAVVDTRRSDDIGSVEFIYSNRAKATTDTSRNLVRPFPATIETVTVIREVSIRDDQDRVVLTGTFLTANRPDANNNVTVPSTTVEAGQVVTLQAITTDPNGDPITVSVTCDRGNFVTVSGVMIRVAPQDGDVGVSSCVATSVDRFGLTSTGAFTVTVTPRNQAPTISAITDASVRAGDTRNITIQTNDPNGTNGLRISLTGAPNFVSISDNGNGTATLRVSPGLAETMGGRVTVQVTDPGGLSAMTSFNVTVMRAINITSASRAKPNLFISGFGFGSSGATVTINGTNVSMRIVGQSDNSITLKGSNRKLNLRTGPNQIQIASGGVMSNTFVLNLLKE